MFIAFLTLLSALSISGVAIFYSVIGLATIFPGQFVAVVIMGSVLEVGKLVTASWLYRHWKQTRFLLKSYLTIAVIVLSLITSMGIFGFLSKAHLEQNLKENTLTQRIDVINNKIESQTIYIKRQNAVIDRAEKTLKRTGTSNTDAIELEKQNLKDVQDKFKTLLVVETNTIENLNSRLKILDKDVSDVLTSNKSFFNEEKAAATLKESQKEERALINKEISEAQGRIAILKQDYADDTDVIQKRIDKLRSGGTTDKTDVEAQIKEAEANILNAQNNIDDLIIDREPLEGKMIKLEAEIGPVKYIAALVIDWGITNDVDTGEAVRWVILIIICVFDPLAVLLLVAANQSLLRRFPVAPQPPPQEIMDLERPEPFEGPVETSKKDDWNDMVSKANALAEKEKADNIQKEWDKKLEAFNEKVTKPDTERPVEFVQDEDESIPHVDLKGQKKTPDKEIVAVNEDGFDEDQVKYDLETPTKKELEEQQKTTTVEKALKMPEAESVETPIEEPTISEQIEEAMEPERTRPDFTEVLKPERAVTGNLGVRIVKDKKVIGSFKPKTPKKETVEPEKPAELTEFERTGMLNKFHQEHGKFEDVDDSVLKEERDEANKAQFLADVALTEEEARNHPPMTASRKAFFQDHIDDVLRGNVLAYQLPEDIRKTVAVLLSEYDDPDIITEGSALIPEGDKNVETMTTEGLKEKFTEQPVIEDRPITDKELDNLLEGFEEEEKGYIQNEEQTDETLWQKTKELDIPEPEKNEIVLPELKSTTEDIPDLADSINVENIIPKEKFTRYKKRLATDDEYHQRVEQRINDMITKLENGEVKLNDLTNDDQKVIMEILNQDG